VHLETIRKLLVRILQSALFDSQVSSCILIHGVQDEKNIFFIRCHDPANGLRDIIAHPHIAYPHTDSPAYCRNAKYPARAY
jgi:hypothetical protein